MPPRVDFTSQRLFIDQPMREGDVLGLDKAQANYLLNVLRMREGSGLLVFNGFDGEWRASLCDVTKKSAALRLTEQTRVQTVAGRVSLAYAPLKSARLDYMVQKAVEMGAARLMPVLTQRTQVSRLKSERMRANVIEAAEQCGILTIPKVEEETRLAVFLEKQTPETILVFCDEAAEVANPVATLQRITGTAPVIVLIGPEGGFSDEERHQIMARQPCMAIALGPRILRADTAAVAALAAVQLAIGDWQGPTTDKPR